MSRTHQLIVAIFLGLFLAYWVVSNFLAGVLG